ncbi:MAG TPA: metallophosphoesterase [Thermoanaerobaculia bacterium]
MTPKTLVLILLCCSAPLIAATDRPLKSFPEAGLKAKQVGADVVFVVGGDNRPTGQGAPLPRVLGTIFSEIGLIRPDFVLWTGDTVYGYCDSRGELEAEYGAFRAAARPLAGAVPLYSSTGNHDIHPGQTCSSPPPAGLCGPPCSQDLFRAHFGQLYGSFDYAGAHFIALDTDSPEAEGSVPPGQLEWLKRDLEANKGARAIFLFTHTEFYSSPLIDSAQGQGHPPVTNRAELEELFRRYPVKAVFSGHEHIYWREPAEPHGGISYFVLGGAGAPLYASPDRGGFSHYLVVRLSGDQVSYDVVEPGRLYLQDLPARAREARFWIVNSNDFAQPLPLRGVDVDVPASLGPCKRLEVTAAAQRRDATVPVPGLTITSCAAAGRGKLRLHIEGPPVGQGSFLVTVHRK